jgi:metal-dependent amidase/aminoacylase/carboxypeptidase family protein
MNMAMTVPDPAGFVADEASAPAVEAGIAATLDGVEAAHVEAVLTVARRLLGSRRLQSGSVNVEATIQADDAAAATALQTAAAAVTADSMATALNEALMDLNVTVTVSSLTAELGDAPAAGGGGGGGGDGDNDGAPKAFVAPILGGLIAQLLFSSF